MEVCDVSIVGLIVSTIQVNISIIAVVLMVLTVKRFFKSDVRNMMVAITLTYLIFGLSNAMRFFNNLVVGADLFGDPLYETFLMLDYGFLILALLSALRVFQYASRLVKNFGGIKSKKVVKKKP